MNLDHIINTLNQLCPTTSITIPKIIMQTWKNNNIPDHWKSSPQTIKSILPDWKYVLMTDNDNRHFVETHFPDFLPFYDNFPYPIQRADAIRPMWLYIHGGIYIDLDFELLKPLDMLFSTNADAYFVASGNFGFCITNSFMASKPRIPFWLSYIEEMKKHPSTWAISKHFKVMTTTGPLALTRTLRKSNLLYTMLPNKLIMPCSVCNIEKCDLTESYLKPLHGQSWNSYDSLVLNYILCNWRTLSFILILIILFIVIYFIFKLFYRMK